MANVSFLQSLRLRLRELRAANGANVTMTFALATIPMVGFVGAAVDYSHANSVKSSMQAAADSTALMLSKTAAGMTAAQIQTKATAYFTALFNRPEAKNLTVTAKFDNTDGNVVLINANSDVKTNFMNLMGFNQLSVGVDAQVKWGNTRLRVSLVLDNTGSMADNNKMTALIGATKNLLTQLQQAATVPDDVYVSIVPFVKDVNVGAGNYNANWLDWTDWNAANGSCSKSGSSNQSACVGTGTCSKSGNNSKNKCQNAGGNWTAATWTPANHNTWNGCVVDRGNSGAPSNGNYDTNVAAPDPTKTATLYAPEQYSSCPNAATKALSYDWTGMTALVNSMTSNGNTNQAIGLQLGWMSLVGGGPFPTPPTMDTKYKYQQIIILLTDGLNTQDRWYSDQTSIDNREKITCDNVNAAGITLYTIQVNTSGDPTSTLLKNCAGSPGKYPDSNKFFLLTSATQIVATFQQIGTALSNLRIAQ